MNRTQKLAGLMSRKRKLEEDIAKTNAELQLTTEKFNKIKNQLQKVKSEIQNLKKESTNPTITDHALLRYLERVKKINIEEIKKEMLSNGRDKIISEMLTLKVPLPNNHFLVAKQGAVVTVT